MKLEFMNDKIVLINREVQIGDAVGYVLIDMIDVKDVKITKPRLIADALEKLIADVTGKESSKPTKRRKKPVEEAQIGEIPND